MARLRNVGRQAANPDDLISLKDLQFALQALPGQYVELSRLNQPQGVPQLDANSRTSNINLPTDISRTSLVATGLVRGGTVESSGVGTFAGELTANSLVSTYGATIGTTLTAGTSVSAPTVTATGALSGASVSVTGAATVGSLVATTIDTPENVRATHKVKALTATSITSTGAVQGTTLSSTAGDVASAAKVTAVGAVTGASMTAAGVIAAGTDLTAVQAVRAASGVFTGNVSADSLNVAAASTLAGVSATSLTVTGSTALGTAVTVNGPVTKQGGGVVTINGGISSNGAIAGTAISGTTITGTGLVKGVGLESTSTLKVAGAVTGVTTLDASGNITISGASSKLVTPDINTGTLLATGNIHVGSGLTATDTHFMVNGHYTRINGNRNELYASSLWTPNNAAALMYTRTPDWSGTAGQDLPYNSWTTVQFTVSADTSNTTLFTNTSNGIRCNIDGEFLFTAKVNYAVMNGCEYGIRLAVNGVANGHTAWHGRTGGPVDQWTTQTAQTVAFMKVGVNSIITVQVFQISIASNNSTWGSDITSDGGRQTRFDGAFLGHRL